MYSRPVATISGCSNAFPCHPRCPHMLVAGGGPRLWTNYPRNHRPTTSALAEFAYPMRDKARRLLARGVWVAVTESDAQGSMPFKAGVKALVGP